jgi:hypothetical protein
MTRRTAYAPPSAFEAAQSEAMRFILIVDRRDAEFPSQSVELDQRTWRVMRPSANLGQRARVIPDRHFGITIGHSG